MAAALNEAAQAAFNPLGNFKVDAPVNEAAIAEAVAFYKKLPNLPTGTSLRHIYNHWTVGHYNQDFVDYNASIRFENGHFHVDLTHNPIENAQGDDGMAEHTWLRNTGGFGISTDDMVFASEHDFGPEPLTLLTLEYLCATNAAVSWKYNIDLAGQTTDAPYAHEHALMTHGEAAMIGGNPAPSAWYDYGVSGTCERWDLGTFVPVPVHVALTKDHVIKCGDAIRARSRLYKVSLTTKLH